jgi:hypothetical protein
MQFVMTDFPQKLGKVSELTGCNKAKHCTIRSFAEIAIYHNGAEGGGSMFL